MLSLFLNEARADYGLPAIGTEVARQWDYLYFFLVGLSVFFFVLVVGGMIYLAVRYRSSVSKKSKYITHNIALETIWTVIPTVLLLVVFGWGYSVYRSMTQAPSDAYEIRVVGKQWLWQFQYDDGRTTVGELVVPLNKPVKLVMTSEDVIHSFFIPNFRVKSDVVPGMYTTVWFEATTPGKHQVFCTEYCGTSHSQMLAKVIVLEEEQWKAWRAGQKLALDSLPNAGVGGMAQMPVTTSQAALVRGEAAGGLSGLALEGKKLTETKGCIACHTADGSQKIGPSFKGIYGHSVTLADGKTIEVDDNYLRESIENPQAKVVKGFAPTMPTFKGLVSETELNSVIAYIKALR